MGRLAWMFVITCCTFATAHTQRAGEEPTKVDEFASICCEDEKARLDYFSTELQNNPGAQGYIIFYGGRRYESCWYGGQRRGARRPRFGEAEKRAARIKPYLINQRGFDPQRITVVNGGYREAWMAELWIVPGGAKPPVPTPTLQRKDIRYRRGRVTKREFQL